MLSLVLRNMAINNRLYEYRNSCRRLFDSIDQGIIGSVQSFLDCLQLACLDMLRTTLDFNKTLTGHIATIDLEHTHEIGLPNVLRLADLSDIFTDTKVLLDFLFHANTPSGLNLVHLGLFYSLNVI